MKFAVALAAILAAVAAVCESSVIKTDPRSNLSVGFVTTGDKLLYRGYVYRAAAPTTVQFEDVVWHGNATTVISVVQATEVGATQTAAAWITAGGLGWSYVTVRFHSYAGLGYYYLLDIWGR